MCHFAINCCLPNLFVIMSRSDTAYRSQQRIHLQFDSRPRLRRRFPRARRFPRSSRKGWHHGVLLCFLVCTCMGCSASCLSMCARVCMCNQVNRRHLNSAPDWCSMKSPNSPTGVVMVPAITCSATDPNLRKGRQIRNMCLEYMRTLKG